MALFENLAKKKEEAEATGSLKSIWKSKTLWVNLVSIVALAIQQKYGFVISEETQIQAIGVINILLRTVTHEPVKW